MRRASLRLRKATRLLVKCVARLLLSPLHDTAVRLAKGSAHGWRYSATPPSATLRTSRAPGHREFSLSDRGDYYGGVAELDSQPKTIQSIYSWPSGGA
jgi:hypothetical protein